MWEQLTPADIERAKHRLALDLGAIVSRHAAELKALDAEQDQIEKLEHSVAAFAEKYVKAGTPTAESMTPSVEQPTEKTIAEHASEAQDQLPVGQIERQLSPSFGIPLRTLVGR